ncbi:CHAT domain-containing protein [Streptomyces sp. NPDC037389]|uniref:CHAT domain-containing protein n=1 Tax=Streptomyces sp. NPDC037389 TaxID=3155369 RepID=UPI0033F48DA1
MAGGHTRGSIPAAAGAGARAGSAWPREQRGSRPPDPDHDDTTAARALSEAADASWQGDPRRANILQTVAGFHQRRGDRRQRQEYLRLAAGDAVAPPHVRLRVACEWADAEAEAGDFAAAADAYAIALGQLVRVTWRARNRVHQEEQLVHRSGLARDAAACAIAAGHPGRAVELLEQGRSVLWAGTLDLRADLTRLAEAAPALRAGLERVRSALDDPRPLEVDRHMQLAQEWDELIDEVRRLEGFEDFLRPLPEGRLLETAAGGPVVIVNVSRWRCDALIVRPDGVTATPLPGLTAQEAADRTDDHLRTLQSAERADEDLKAAWARARSTRAMPDRQAAQQAERALRTARAAAEESLTGLLGWLWDVVAEPVLTALGTDGPPAPGDPWPRLWWCPTGPLTLLPLHAAGYHDDPLRTVMDRTQSSYTPSLRALSHARTPSDPAATGGDRRMLMVALADAPGQEPLAGVADELAMMERVLAPDRTTVLAGPAASRDAVRQELHRHRCVHFSCHGDQMLDDPSHGGLALYDGVLTIADVGGQRCPADFAGLSACKTAVGGTELADEAITLAAALHHVGCRHVVGALWSVYDSPGTAELFEDLYRGMARDGFLDPGLSSPALHHAVRTLREANRSRPTVWTPFVHIGP